MGKHIPKLFVIFGASMIAIESVAKAQESQDLPFGVAAYVEGDIPIHDHPDHICGQANNCPANVKLRDPATLDYQGCIAAGAVCSGDCTLCSGSLNPVNQCVPDPGPCYIHSIPAFHVNCGVKRFQPCVYSAVKPPGEPWQTKNKCYCVGLIGPLTNEPCIAVSCT